MHPASLIQFNRAAAGGSIMQCSSLDVHWLKKPPQETASTPYLSLNMRFCLEGIIIFTVYCLYPASTIKLFHYLRSSSLQMWLIHINFSGQFYVSRVFFFSIINMSCVLSFVNYALILELDCQHSTDHFTLYYVVYAPLHEKRIYVFSFIF